MVTIPSPDMGKKNRVRRGLLLLFVLPSLFFGFLILSLALHLNLPSARAALKGVITENLSELLVGRFEIDDIVNLDPQLIEARDLRVYDEEGQKVMDVKSLRINLHLFDAVVRLLTSPSKFNIKIQRVEFNDVWTGLYPQGDGSSDEESSAVPTLARAFSVVESSDETTTNEDSGVLLELPNITLKKLKAESYLFNTPRITAQIPETQVSLQVDAAHVAIHLPHYEIDLKGLTKQGSSLAGDLMINVPGKISGQLSGHVADIAVSEEFIIDGQEIDVRGQAPEVDPEKARSLYPDWPFDQAIRLRHQFVGALSDLELRVDLSTNPQEKGLAEHLILTGEANLVKPWSAELHLDTADLDLQRLKSDLPETELHLRSDIHLEEGEVTPLVVIDATLLPSRIAQQNIPAIGLLLTYEKDELKSDLRLLEEDLPIDADISWDGADQVDISLNLKSFSLQENARLREVAPEFFGIISGGAQAQYSLASQHLKGQVDLDITEAHHPIADCSTGRLNGEFSLSVENPEKLSFDGSFIGEGLKIANLHLLEFEIVGKGQTDDADIEFSARSEQGTELSLTTHYRKGSIELLDTSGKMTPKKGKPVTLELERFYWGDEELSIEGLSLKSQGQIEADLRHTPESTDVRLKAKQLNLTRILKAFDLDHQYGALIDANIDAQLGKHSSGKIQVNLHDAHYDQIHHAEAQLALGLKKQSLQGALEVKFEGLGDISSTGTLELAGDSRQLESYQKALGELNTQAHTLDLKFIESLGIDAIKQLVGTLDAQATLKRSSYEQLPSVKVQLQTNQLGLIWQNPQTAPLDNLDFDLNLETLDSEHKVRVALKARDDFGELSAASAQLALPLNLWNHSLPETQVEWLQLLRQAPLEAVLNLRERSLKDLPQVLNLPTFEGRAMGRLTASGTAFDPQFGASLLLEDFKENDGLFNKKLHLDSQLSYRPTTGELKGRINAADKNKRLASTSFDLNLPLESILVDQSQAKPLWQGEAEILIDALPTQLFSALTESEFTGTLKGGIHIKRRGWLPKIDADLDLVGIAVGARPLGRGKVTIANQGSHLLVGAKLRDAYGQLECKANIPLSAQPSSLGLDRSERLVARLKSQNYDASVIGPFVDPILSELSGALNGELELSMNYDPKQRWQTTLIGEMSMNQGVILPKAMGLRLRDTTFKLKATHKNQRNYLKIEELEAKARSQKVNIRGNGELIFHNLDLEKASFELRQDKVPLLSDGVRLATVSGKTQMELSQLNGGYDLRLQFPEYDVELSDSNDHDLISLDEDPNIEIYQPINTSRKVAVEENTPFRIALNLGTNFRVHNRYIELTLQGTPLIHYHEQLSMSGIIELKAGGIVQVLGRKFIVEHGTVSFDGADFAEPFINTTAAWRTPGGSIVRATVSGTPSNLNIDWSSDPAMPGGEAEIIAMVLGGGRSDDQGAGNMAIAVAINEALGQITNKIDVYTATESDGGEGAVGRLNERTQQSYTAAYQINDKVWVEGSYKVQSTQPGTEYRGFSGTVDWRFKDDWSMRTEAGELGVGLELLWYYRY